MGAGPAGISAAHILAGRGSKPSFLNGVNIRERKICPGGVLYGHDLAGIIPDFSDQELPRRDGISLNRGSGIFPEMGVTAWLSWTRSFCDKLSFNAFTVGRAKFDRWFAEQAKKKAPSSSCGTVVTDLSERRRQSRHGVAD